MGNVERYVFPVDLLGFSFLQGAVVLHSDPSCWDDVLLPARLVKLVFLSLELLKEVMKHFSLFATCASCQASSVPAAFFFRCGCGAHNADETAVPLHLINSNLEEVIRILKDNPIFEATSSPDALPCLYRGGGASGGVFLQASHLRPLLCRLLPQQDGGAPVCTRS